MTSLQEEINKNEETFINTILYYIILYLNILKFAFVFPNLTTAVHIRYITVLKQSPEEKLFDESPDLFQFVAIKMISFISNIFLLGYQSEYCI